MGTWDAFTEDLRNLSDSVRSYETMTPQANIKQNPLYTIPTSDPRVKAVVAQIVALSPNHPLEVDYYDEQAATPSGEFYTAHYVVFSWGGPDSGNAVPAITGMLILRPDVTINALRISGALPPT